MARTQEMAKGSYEIARQIHNLESDKAKFDKAKAEGRNRLIKEYGMNPKSAYKYIDDIIYMLNGKMYKYLIKKDHTKYFLEKIEEDFGVEGLEKALSAVEKHINYCDIKGKSCSVEKLYHSFKKKLGEEDRSEERRVKYDFLAGKNNDEPPTSKELSEEEDKATARSLNDEQRKDRLSKKENKLPETEVKPVKIYKRDADVRAEALKNANGFCAKCNKEAPFKREDGALKGQPYLEVHHKIWLSEGGEDTTENAVALCPNCHQEEHHGKRKWVKQ